MPPKGKLPDKDIAMLEKWVKDGLPVPADRIGGGGREGAKGGVVTEEAKKYWAYQPVKRPAVPEVRRCKSGSRTRSTRSSSRSSKRRGSSRSSPRTRPTLVAAGLLRPARACRRRRRRSTRSSTTRPPKPTRS